MSLSAVDIGLLAPWLAFSLLLTLGVWARGAAAGIVIVGALLLLDRVISNHLYLIMLVGILLSISDSERHFALRSRGTGPVRAWTLFLLGAQLSIVYGFAALAKLNASWLSGHTLSAFLTQAILPVPDVGVLFSVVAVMVVLVELGLAAAPWFARLRKPAFVVAVIVHVGMLSVAHSLVDALQIGLLGVLMLVLFLPFFAPSLGLRGSRPPALEG